jgi:hypothetical protein
MALFRVPAVVGPGAMTAGSVDRPSGCGMSRIGELIISVFVLLLSDRNLRNCGACGFVFWVVSSGTYHTATNGQPAGKSALEFGQFCLSRLESRRYSARHIEIIGAHRILPL